MLKKWVANWLYYPKRVNIGYKRLEYDFAKDRLFEETHSVNWLICFRPVGSGFRSKILCAYQDESLMQKRLDFWRSIAIGTTVSDLKQLFTK